MHHGIQVMQRNLRWEIVNNGVTRPVVDWFCTKARALEDAVVIARENGHAQVEVLDWLGSVKETIAVSSAA